MKVVDPSTGHDLKINKNNNKASMHAAMTYLNSKSYKRGMEKWYKDVEIEKYATPIQVKKHVDGKRFKRQPKERELQKRRRKVDEKRKKKKKLRKQGKKDQEMSIDDKEGDGEVEEQQFKHAEFEKLLVENRESESHDSNRNELPNQSADNGWRPVITRNSKVLRKNDSQQQFQKLTR